MSEPQICAPRASTYLFSSWARHARGYLTAELHPFCEVSYCQSVRKNGDLTATPKLFLPPPWSGGRMAEPIEMDVVGQDNKQPEVRLCLLPPDMNHWNNSDLQFFRFIFPSFQDYRLNRQIIETAHALLANQQPRCTHPAPAAHDLAERECVCVCVGGWVCVWERVCGVKHACECE